MGNQSKILKILSFVAGFVVLYVIYLSYHNKQAAKAATVAAVASPDAAAVPNELPLPGTPAASQSTQVKLGNMTADELRQLGADADSPTETLKTLVAEIAKLRKENAEVKAASEEIFKRNQSLSQMEATLTARFDEKLNQERDRLANEVADKQNSARDSVMSTLEQRLTALKKDNPVLNALSPRSVAPEPVADPQYFPVSNSNAANSTNTSTTSNTSSSNTSNNSSGGSLAPSQQAFDRSELPHTDAQVYEQLGITPGAKPTSNYVAKRGTGASAKADPYALPSFRNDDEIVWIKPMDAIEEPKTGGAATGGTAVPTVRYPEVDLTASAPAPATDPAAAEASPTAVAANGQTTSVPKPDIKAYTLPQNATLMGSVTMTSLIGRILRKGSLFDPYPFKLLIGDDNLAANGIFIPNVSGIVVSGFASGDWTLSCVSGTVTSLTFVFQDGTIRTYPKPSAGGAGSKKAESLGWLSDSQGVPCITGERITNAPSFLLQRIGLTIGSAYYAAAAAAETTTSNNQFAGANTGGSSTEVTGDKGSYAKNQAISAGVNEGTDWLKERQEQEFDAIYVKPGVDVALHLDQEIAIDFEVDGRQVDHHAILPYQKTNKQKRSQRLD